MLYVIKDLIKKKLLLKCKLVVYHTIATVWSLKFLTRI